MWYTPTIETLDTLTAPGNSEFTVRDDFHYLTAQYTVSDINTNVITRIEGSLDGDNWFSLLDSDVTVTANGTYAHFYGRFVPYVRFVFVSEAGGTDAGIVPKILLER